MLSIGIYQHLGCVVMNLDEKKNHFHFPKWFLMCFGWCTITWELGLAIFYTLMTFDAHNRKAFIPLPHMPILGSANSAVNKDMI